MTVQERTRDYETQCRLFISVDHIFCWGSIYIVSKYALAVMGPVTVGMCRYAVSVLCLYGLLKLKGGAKKIQPEHWKYLLILGGLGYFVSIILQLGGTALLSGSLASLINSLNPVVISIMAALFFKGADYLEECSQHCGIPDRCLHHSGEKAAWRSI